MNCNEARRHWSLYYDSEGDAELFLQINEHLECCSECAEWFHLQSEFEDEVVQRLRRTAPTPELWGRIYSRVGIERTAPSSAPRAGRLLLVAAAVLAAGLLLAVWLGGERSQPDVDLARLTAKKHEQLAQGATQVEFASHSDLEVESYLRRRVRFPVRCPPREDTGFRVSGAGVSRLAGEPVAYVFGSVNGRPVSIFILSRDSLREFPGQYRAVRREGIHRCREGENEMVMAEIHTNAVLVTGAVDSGRLLRVLKAYGSYPHNGHSI